MKKEEQKPNNPLAFPMEEHYEHDSTRIYAVHNGMTLRDYFAAHAIQDTCSYRPKNLWHWIKYLLGFNYQASHRPHNENAERAYELADAMLKERSRV